MFEQAMSTTRDAMDRVVRVTASLAPAAVALALTTCFICISVLLGDGAAAGELVQRDLREERAAWRSHWTGEVQELREDADVPVRFVRDPLSGCEYVVVPEGITVRLGPDGHPYCPVDIELSEQLASTAS